MPPHLTKKAEAPPGSAAANRRSGRPRAATAASKIYWDLRAQLVSLQRRPGEVVSEAEIALSYGVSRTPVREAILKLSDEGLLEIFPQSGIFVSRNSDCGAAGSDHHSQGPRGNHRTAGRRARDIEPDPHAACDPGTAARG